MSKNAVAEPTVKQIILKDFTRKPCDPPISGILLADGSVICGTTGKVFPADKRGETWDVQKEYEAWTSLDDVVLGYDKNIDYSQYPVEPYCCCHCSGYDECIPGLGTCFKYGGQVDGCNVAEDCIHGTDGLLLWCRFKDEQKPATCGCDLGNTRPVTFLPMDTELEPDAFVKYILSLKDDENETPEGLLVLRHNLKDFLEDQGLEDFSGLELYYKRDVD